jgi:RIO kinase 1
VTQDDVTMDQYEYEYYEELFDPAPAGRNPHRRLKADQKPKKTRSAIIAELTDDLADVDLGFSTTYRPSRHESGWLLSSLHSFYHEGLITDVLAQIKGGKEASVYRCQATAATGGGMLAAKVYRPRMFRNLRNDKMYRQGREILVAGGGQAGRDGGHIRRAIRKKSAFGLQAAHTSWLMYEFTAMEQLYEAGGAVPQPIAPSPNAILMSYHGDERMAAPTLNTVRLERDEAEELFREVLRNVDLMLQHDLVHGDLSAYNILYWPQEGSPGKITLIDFPQVINLRTNLKARFVLKRDIQRICEYFAQQGVECDPAAIMDDLWDRHVETLHPDDLKADWSSLLAGLEDALRDRAEAETLPDWAPALD